jgi:hypothetical protein
MKCPEQTTEWESATDPLGDLQKFCKQLREQCQKPEPHYCPWCKKEVSLQRKGPDLELTLVGCECPE